MPRDFVPLVPAAELKTRPFQRAYAVSDGPGAQCPRPQARRPARSRPRGAVPLSRSAWRAASVGHLARQRQVATGRVVDQPEKPPHRTGDGQPRLAALFWQGPRRNAQQLRAQGRPPTHPGFLDYLADRFMADGWSVKRLLRLLVLSRAYRMDSFIDESNQKSDPRNVAHWRAERAPAAGRGGSRRPSRGGRRPGVLARRVTPLPVGSVVVLHPAQALQRPLRHRPAQRLPDDAVRMCRHPFLALFDGADPSVSTAQRGVTTVPTQALFFLNNPLVHQQADRLAGRLLAWPGGTSERIDRRIGSASAGPPARRNCAKAKTIWPRRGGA